MWPHVVSLKSADGTISNIFCIISDLLPMGLGTKSSGISSRSRISVGKSWTRISQLIGYPPVYLLRFNRKTLANCDEGFSIRIAGLLHAQNCLQIAKQLQ